MIYHGITGNYCLRKPQESDKLCPELSGMLHYIGGNFSEILTSFDDFPFAQIMNLSQFFQRGLDIMTRKFVNKSGDSPQKGHVKDFII